MPGGHTCAIFVIVEGNEWLFILLCVKGPLGKTLLLTTRELLSGHFADLVSSV